MTYTPTEWKSGDVITAEKLNNMEEGISEFFIVDLISQDGETFTASESRSDILSAISGGKVVLARYKFAMGDSIAIGGTAAIRFWMGVYFAVIDVGDDGSGVARVKYICNTSLNDDYTWTIRPTP